VEAEGAQDRLTRPVPDMPGTRLAERALPAGLQIGGAEDHRCAAAPGLGPATCHPGASQWAAALVAAKRFLVDTAEAVGPELSAPVLLDYATRYRAHLAALVAASRNAEDGDITPGGIS